MRFFAKTSRPQSIYLALVGEQTTGTWNFDSVLTKVVPGIRELINSIRSQPRAPDPLPDSVCSKRELYEILEQQFRRRYNPIMDLVLLKDTSTELGRAISEARLPLPSSSASFLMNYSSSSPSFVFVKTYQVSSPSDA